MLMGTLRARRVGAFALVVFAVVASSACTANNILIGWRGHHYSELVEQWGPPGQVLDDGQCGRVLIYTSPPWNEAPATPAAPTPTAFDAAIWGKPETVKSYETWMKQQGRHVWRGWRLLAIDTDGTIYTWSIDGSYVEGTVPKKQFRRWTDCPPR
jgi:hypothetical protein